MESMTNYRWKSSALWITLLGNICSGSHMASNLILPHYDFAQGLVHEAIGLYPCLYPC